MLSQFAVQIFLQKSKWHLQNHINKGIWGCQLLFRINSVNVRFKYIVVIQKTQAKDQLKNRFFYFKNIVAKICTVALDLQYLIQG